MTDEHGDVTLLRPVPTHLTTETTMKQKTSIALAGVAYHDGPGGRTEGDLVAASNDAIAPAGV